MTWFVLSICTPSALGMGYVGLVPLRRNERTAVGVTAAASPGGIPIITSAPIVAPATCFRKIRRWGGSAQSSQAGAAASSGSLDIGVLQEK